MKSVKSSVMKCTADPPHLTVPLCLPSTAQCSHSELH